MNLNTLSKALIFAGTFLLISVWAVAQPGNPGLDPDPGVPLDLGLSAFIAAGVGYAAKKRMDKKKPAKLPTICISNGS